MRVSMMLGSALYAGLLMSDAASATVLETYEFQGQPGTETSVSPSLIALNLSGNPFGETNVTPNAGANSINSNGWNNAGAAYTFGFNVLTGITVSIDQLILSMRSSATGPGFLNLLASVNGGGFATVASIVQSGTNFNDEMLSTAPLTGITSSVAFQLVAANQVSASGGTIGSTGTFRVGDYNPAGTPIPFTINGTIASTPPTAVPEPTTLALLVGGMLALRGRRRRLT